MINLLNEDYCRDIEKVSNDNFRKANPELVEKEITALFEGMQEDLNELYYELEVAQRYGQHYEILGEGIIASSKLKAKSAKQKVKRIGDRVDNKVADRIKNIENSIKEDVRDKKVKGIPFKVTKLVKTAAIAGAAWAVNPALLALGILAKMTIGNYLTAREKDRLMNELTQELEIVEEKIKDADANGDKEKKYQLMRLRNEIKRNKMKISSGTRASEYLKK